MADTTQIFDMASLTEAAHADIFKDGILQADSGEVKILIAKGWPDTQATEFPTHNRVIDRSSTVDTPARPVGQRLNVVLSSALQQIQ